MKCSDGNGRVHLAPSTSLPASKAQGLHVNHGLSPPLRLRLRRQQGLLEGIPMLRRQQRRVNHRHFSLNLNGAAIRPGDFQLGMRMVPARGSP